MVLPKGSQSRITGRRHHEYQPSTDGELFSKSKISYVRNDYRFSTDLQTVGNAIRKDPVGRRVAAAVAVKISGETLISKRTVRELLFEGYEDRLLKYLKSLHRKDVVVPLTEFAWFLNRNGSSSADGRISMYTGQDDISKLGLVSLWNGQDRTNVYPRECGRVEGTTGDVWPPEANHTKPLVVFVPDFCRSIELQYEEEEDSTFNVASQKYVADESNFNRSCFCGSADPPGVMDLRRCKLGAPLFLSYPHFYLADESYRRKVTGMAPDKKEHEILERSLGVVMKARTAVQINVMMDDYFRVP